MTTKLAPRDRISKRIVEEDIIIDGVHRRLPVGRNEERVRIDNGIGTSQRIYVAIFPPKPPKFIDYLPLIPEHDVRISLTINDLGSGWVLHPEGWQM